MDKKKLKALIKETKQSLDDANALLYLGKHHPKFKGRMDTLRGKVALVVEKLDQIEAETNKKLFWSFW